MHHENHRQVAIFTLHSLECACTYAFKVTAQPYKLGMTRVIPQKYALRTYKIRHPILKIPRSVCFPFALFLTLSSFILLHLCYCVCRK